tara:strand:- start:312 stop:776 length:465 start_codon:yes stop_codon:yes gene_type:complete
MSDIVILTVKDVHSEMIWEWRNDPITRQMFINSEKVSWEEHSSWFEKVLLDTCTKLYVGEARGIPVGVLRFDKCESEKYVYEVSINISPASRGKGFGKKLMTYGIKKLHKEVANCNLIRAEVKKENQSSNKLFKSCGFIFIKRELEMNTYELSL